MKDVMLGVLRHVLTAGGGVLVGKGVLTAATVDSTVGAVLTLIGVVWSVVTKMKSKDSAPV